MCIYCKLFFTYIPRLFYRCKLVLVIENNPLELFLPPIPKKELSFGFMLLINDYATSFGSWAAFGLSI